MFILLCSPSAKPGIQLVLNKYFLKVGKKAGSQEGMCVGLPKLLRRTQRKYGARPKVWVRTEFAQFPRVSAAESLKSMVMRGQVCWV